jgi:hypothetical protein
MKKTPWCEESNVGEAVPSIKSNLYFSSMSQLYKKYVASTVPGMFHCRKNDGEREEFVRVKRRICDVGGLGGEEYALGHPHL